MKPIVVVCSFVLLSVVVYGAQAPFPLWLDIGNDYVNPRGERVLASEKPGFLGSSGQKVSRFIYDVSLHGGASGANGVGVYLPAGSVIERSFFKVITQFSDSGSGTVALSCEDANNIKTATDITGETANAFVEGESDGTAANFKRGIAARCEITATVATADQDAGKLVGWVRYFIEE